MHIGNILLDKCITIWQVMPIRGEAVTRRQAGQVAASATQDPREVEWRMDMTRTSIARLADDAPVARPDSWVERKPPFVTYIDETPVMNAVHAALTAEARSTAIAVIKMCARAYALQPKHLDAIAKGLSALSPRHLVHHLLDTRDPRWFIICGGNIPLVNIRGAMLYARYSRAKAHQIAKRAA